MWQNMGRQVTSTIFRLERESPEFVGGLWDITGTVHEEVNAGSDFAGGGESFQESSSSDEPGEEYDAIETIRNTEPKIGRNDPCTCGSGKKYKKCCGKK